MAPIHMSIPCRYSPTLWYVNHFGTDALSFLTPCIHYKHISSRISMSARGRYAICDSTYSYVHPPVDIHVPMWYMNDFGTTESLIFLTPLYMHYKHISSRISLSTRTRGIYVIWVTYLFIYCSFYSRTLWYINHFWD